jgi:hypothetical protein
MPQTTQATPGPSKPADPARKARLIIWILLGVIVTGTPTFFLNGEKLTLNSEEQFRQLLDNAVK